jgi:spermidine synthase
MENAANFFKCTTLVFLVIAYATLEKLKDNEMRPTTMAQKYKESEILYRKQNTLGNLTIEEIKDSSTHPPKISRIMTINKIIQGDQNTEEKNKTYDYIKLTELIRNEILKESDKSQRWLALGLGVGTIAAAGQAGDNIKIAEINPHVIEAAQAHFNYIKESEAQIEIILGDGRKILKQQPKNTLDLIICDAYAGGSIPQHMMTKEFFEIAKERLKENGIIAVHISHGTLDLKPVLTAIGTSLHLEVWDSRDENIVTAEATTEKSTWILFT